MGVLQSPGYRCRHVVFAAAPARPPLNLGRPPAPAPAPAPNAAAALTTDPGPPTDEDAFVAFLFSRAGLDARAYRTTSLRRRVPACLRALRAKTLPDARRLLTLNPGLVPVAVGSLLIGVTGFFRDAGAFALMSRQLLPALAHTGRRLRVWSAACSDGAELYSVAMLLAELNVLHRCELLGTDCRGEAVARAAAGRYDAAACRADDVSSVSSSGPDVLGSTEPAAAPFSGSASSETCCGSRLRLRHPLMNRLRMIVWSHARGEPSSRYDPKREYARKRVSCTRSSASEALRVRWYAGPCSDASCGRMIRSNGDKTAAAGAGRSTRGAVVDIVG